MFFNFYIYIIIINLLRLFLRLLFTEIYEYFNDCIVTNVSRLRSCLAQEPGDGLVFGNILASWHKVLLARRSGSWRSSGCGRRRWHSPGTRRPRRPRNEPRTRRTPRPQSEPRSCPRDTCPTSKLRPRWC